MPNNALPIENTFVQHQILGGTLNKIRQLRKTADRYLADDNVGASADSENGWIAGLAEELAAYQAELESQIEGLNRSYPFGTLSPESYCRFFQDISLPALICDHAGHIQAVNQSAEQFLSIDSNLVSSRLSLLSFVKGGARSLKLDLKACSSSAASQEKRRANCHRVNLLLASGQTVACDVSVSKLSAIESRCLVLVVDKSHEVEVADAKAEAEAANLAKSQFLSSMSHELRTPLNSILGFAQLIEFEENISADCRDFVGHIEKAGYYLLTLINEVIDLSRIEIGKMSFSMESVHLGSVVDESINLVSVLAGKMGVDIIKKIPEQEPCFVKADCTRLRQVLVNYLSNAIKYNKPNGSVTISCQKTIDGFVLVSVADTGQGIPEDRKKAVFSEPFNRLGRESSNIEGTGIGLVLCKSLVNEMGGKVGFESREGVGSYFWLSLPIGDEPSKTVGCVETKFRDLSAISDKRILLAEDNPVNRILAIRFLRDLGFNSVTPAINGARAVELVAQHTFDIILMDCQMPEMDGFDATRLIRRAALNAKRRIPIIAITASAMEIDKQRCFAAGMDDYLSKPYKLYDLGAMLDKWLNEPSV